MRHSSPSPRPLTFEPLDDRRMLAGNVFHYAVDPFDVNQDGQHNTADLRAVWTDLAENGPRSLQDVGAAIHYKVDVSGDGLLNTQDLRQLFAILTSTDTAPSDELQDVVADEPLVTRQIHIAEGGGGDGGLGDDGFDNGGGGIGADFQSLIDLIQSTIPTEAWDVPGTGMLLAEFPQNLSLIVTQTQQVQDEIADLLEQLRALQDLQITVETRFLTISDDFFERIGIDFDFNINDDTPTDPTNNDSGPIVNIGVDSNGDPIIDLDLSFVQESLNVTPPQFGGFDAGEAANFGLAILSDIEAFFFLQAAQADRADVLAAPIVNLLDGQIGSFVDNVQQQVNNSVEFDPVRIIIQEE